MSTSNHLLSTIGSCSRFNSSKEQQHPQAQEVCAVCGDRAIGLHYGRVTCHGCKGFFRRTVCKKLHYTCRTDGRCTVDQTLRNICRACRYRKCLERGMRPELVRCSTTRTDDALALLKEIDVLVDIDRRVNEHIARENSPMMTARQCVIHSLSVWANSLLPIVELKHAHKLSLIASVSPVWSVWMACRRTVLSAAQNPDSPSSSWLSASVVPNDCCVAPPRGRQFPDGTRAALDIFLRRLVEPVTRISLLPDESSILTAMILFRTDLTDDLDLTAKRKLEAGKSALALQLFRFLAQKMKSPEAAVRQTRLMGLFQPLDTATASITRDPIAARLFGLLDDQQNAESPRWFDAIDKTLLPLRPSEG